MEKKVFFIPPKAYRSLDDKRDKLSNAWWKKQANRKVRRLLKDDLCHWE